MRGWTGWTVHPLGSRGGWTPIPEALLVRTLLLLLLITALAKQQGVDASTCPPPATCPRCGSTRVLPGPFYDRARSFCHDCGARL